jgi:hypothetical protein
MTRTSIPGELPLSQAQDKIAAPPYDKTIFLEGPSGGGKTSAGAVRLSGLLRSGIPGSSILVLLPHRPLAGPYLRALGIDPGVQEEAVENANILTIAGIARRMVRRYWSQVAGPSGFANPRQPPVFLNHETSQVVMARVVLSLLDQGYLETITLERYRIYSQILDSLSRAAGCGIPYVEVGHRLKSAWAGEPGQNRVFDDLQECIVRFRQYCLSHNLLDFSLLMDVFHQRVWPDAQIRETFFNTYRHLIADNIEEDLPVAHDLLRDWLPRLSSALLIYDWDGGYRSLMGADPQSAYSLKDGCTATIVWEQSYIMPAEVASFAGFLGRKLSPGYALEGALATNRFGEVGVSYETDSDLRAPVEPSTATDTTPAIPVSPIVFNSVRFYPEMLDWVTAQVSALVHQEGVLPSEIALLAPFLNDSLVFSLVDRLEREGIPARSLRPSRPLRSEPGVGCLLTLAALAHPHWFEGGFRRDMPSPYDVTYALVQAVQGMDLVRAQLLTQIAYRTREGLPFLSSFETIRPDVQERITEELGEGYETIRLWLEDYTRREPLNLDEFWERLLAEVLTLPGFGFIEDINVTQAASNLIDSARNYRQVTETVTEGDGQPSAQEFLFLVRNGLVPAQYMRLWEEPGAEAVLLAPAFTFLIANRPVDVQFWLDAGSRNWWGRMSQPLTHTHVLSRQWPEGRIWTDEDELAADRESLYRLSLGLVRRCRKQIWVAASELSETGYDQEGPLLRVFQQ